MRIFKGSLNNVKDLEEMIFESLTSTETEETEIIKKDILDNCCSYKYKKIAIDKELYIFYDSVLYNEKALLDYIVLNSLDIYKVLSENKEQNDSVFIESDSKIIFVLGKKAKKDFINIVKKSFIRANFIITDKTKIKTLSNY